MPDPNLPLLEDAVSKLAPFLDEIVFVGGVTLGLLITDKAAAPIRGTNDVDVIAEIVTYADYIAFSERLRGTLHRRRRGTPSYVPVAQCWPDVGCTGAQRRSARVHEHLV
jgi:hypothetical protein